MSKYASGSYQVHEFDRKGTRLRTSPVDGGFSAAQAFGERQKKRAACHSFAVARILYNSLDPVRERYDAVSDL